MPVGRKHWEEVTKNTMLKYHNKFVSLIDYDCLVGVEKELLLRNGRYKDIHKNKRCFILGNGPSVNKVDWSLLEDELVITVNEMFRHKDFSKLKSDYHFFADPFYLQLNENNQRDREVLEKISVLSEYGTKLWLPIEGKNPVKKYGWDKKIDINYFSSKLDYYDDFNEEPDFARFVPRFQAVVQWAIYFAIYSGCSEIYLLGCDSTNIAVDIALTSKQDVELQYAYDLGKASSDHSKKLHADNGIEYTLFGYWRIIHLFVELNKYCKKRGVKLYNCSEESVVPAITKVRFEEII